MCQVDDSDVTKGGENDDWVARALMQVFDALSADVHRHSLLCLNARLHLLSYGSSSRSCEVAQAAELASSRRVSMNCGLPWMVSATGIGDVPGKIQTKKNCPGGLQMMQAPSGRIGGVGAKIRCSCASRAHIQPPEEWVRR